jgi:type IV secretory pathway TrbD component
MKQNVGNADRIIRIVLGLGIIAWGVVAQNWLGAIGLVPLATAFMRWCPAYLPFGITTCRS